VRNINIFGRFAFVASVFCFFVIASNGHATEIVKVISPGGIEAWLVEEHSIPLITVQIGFRGGAAIDPKGKAGLANMVSSLLDEGAGDLDSAAFQQQLEDKAIRLGFDARMDRFSGSLMTLTEERDEAFRLLGLALNLPRFDDQPVERIRKQIIVSLRHRLEDPNRIANQTLSEHLFGAHPYGRPVEGTEQSVSQVEVADLRKFVKDRFTKDNLSTVVVGDINAKELEILLDKTFGALIDKGPNADTPEAQIRADGHIQVVEKNIPQSVVAFGHGAVKRDDPDWYAAYVVNYILGGGGFSSRLMHEVREKRGLAYSVGSYLYPYEHAGLFQGHVATANERVAESIKLIRAEIARLQADGPSKTELANAKTYITGSFPLSLDSNSKIARLLVMVRMRGLGIDYIDRRNSFIEAVTLDDVKRVARTLFDPENLVFIVVGSPDGVSSSGPTKAPNTGPENATTNQPASEG
jgi:zinc protease